MSNFPSDETDKAIATVSTLASFIPCVGGAVSNVLSGHSQQRKFNRVQEVLDGLAARLDDLKSKVNEEYVRTEDFEELLEQTLRKAADERNAEIRDLYARFLHHVVTESTDDYDDQIEVMRVIESLRSVHIKVMNGLLEKPDPNPPFAGSVSQTLQRRTGLSEEQIRNAIEILNDLRLTNVQSSGMMTGHGAERLDHTIAPLGTRVLEYLRSLQ